MTNKEYNKIAKAVQKETRKGDVFIANTYKFEKESKRIERKANIFFACVIFASCAFIACFFAYYLVQIIIKVIN